MVERATVNQVTQIGVEATPGTAVAALKKLQALSIEPGIKANINSYRPMGAKYQTIAALGKEWTEASIEGPLAYNDLTYLLASVLSYAAPVQQGGTAAYLWTFTPAQSAEDTVKTFTVESGSPVRAGRFTYGLVNELGITITRDEATVSGSMFGRRYEDDVHLSTNATYTLTAAATPPSSGNFTLTCGAQTTANIAHNATPAAVETALEALSTIGTGNVEVVATVATGAGNLSVAANVYTVEFVNALAQAPRTLTGTFTSLDPSGSIALAAGTVGVVPTAIALMPVLPTQVDVYCDTTGAGLGGTQLLRALRTELSIGGRFGQVWPLNSSLSGFDTHVELAPGATLKLLVAADSAGMGLLTPMRSGDKRFIRTKAVGPLADTGHYYTLQMDVCGQVAEVGEFSDEDGIYALEYTFNVAYDATWTKAIEVQLKNLVSAL